jgi:hypothetical protein
LAFGCGRTVNISKAWIGRIEKEGMFGPLMKKGFGEEGRISESELAVGTNCDGTTHICQVWFNTSSLSSGRYFVTIVANDTSGNEQEEFNWFQVKTFDIKSPELLRVIIPVSTSYKFTNASAIKTDKTWKSCSDSAVTPPSGVTNCKAIDKYKT